MIKQFCIKAIDRVIAHRIVQKSEDAPCYADTHDSLYNLNQDDKKVLIQRIEKAVNNRKKCFELSFRDKGKDSMYEHLKRLGFVSDNDDYIRFSEEAAGKSSARCSRLASSNERQGRGTVRHGWLIALAMGLCISGSIEGDAILFEARVLGGG